MFPELKQVHIGDLFYLRCNAHGEAKGQVSWFHNDNALQTSNDDIKIQFAATKHSGTYHCVIFGGARSNNLFISVLSKMNTPSHCALTSQK